MIASILPTRRRDHLARRLVDGDRGQQRLIELQVDPVVFALPRREAAVDREDARHVGLVVLVVGRVVELHQLAVLQHLGAAVIVRVVAVPAGRHQREVGDAERAVLLEDVVGLRLQLVLAQAGTAGAHRGDDALAGDPGRFAQQRDLPRALHGPQRVDDRIEIADLQRRRRRLQAGDERRFARVAAVPGILPVRLPHPRRIALRLAAQDLRRERRVDRPPLGGQRGASRPSNPASGRTSSTPSPAAASGPGASAGPNMLVSRRAFAGWRNTVVRLRAPVDDQHGARLDDAAQVEALAVLPERHLARRLGGAEHDGHAVADAGHHARAAGGVFLGRKDLAAAKHRLRQRRGRTQRDRRDGAADCQSGRRSHAQSLPVRVTRAAAPAADRGAPPSTTGPAPRRWRRRRAAASRRPTRSGRWRSRRRARSAGARDPSSDSGSAQATPAATSESASRRISQRIRVERAPRAMRTPSSRVRWSPCRPSRRRARPSTARWRARRTARTAR